MIFVVGRWLITSVRKSRQLKAAKHWPLAEATIQSGAMEVVFHSRYGSRTLPCFAFTFEVDGEYHSGRFSLEADGERGEELTRNLVNRKLTVSYDPYEPDNWFIPMTDFAGFPLHQRLEWGLTKLCPDD